MISFLFYFIFKSMKTEKQLLRYLVKTIAGSRNLSGHRNGFDEMDFLCDYNSRSPDYENDDDYLLAQRRIKERAAAAFEEDLAELRRKRRDMQVTLHYVYKLIRTQ